MTPSTVCYRCDRTYRDTDRVRCDCGEPLWFDIDSHGFDLNDRGDGRGLSHYAGALPLSELEGLATAAGNTPLIRSQPLDEVAGCRVFVKDEGGNPTGSYKDRGSAIAVSRALDRSDNAVGTVSYGNMAMSTAAHAASRGRECVVLVPDDIPPGRLELIGQYDPTILRVEGDYGGLYDEVLELSRELPVSFLLSDAPGRISGYKTALFEIYEAMTPATPDAIALPASSGGFASGIWRGILDLQTAGVIDDPPRLYLVQTAASDPITRAFEADRDAVSALPPEDVGETIAHSIGNPDPPSGTRALTAVRETGGAVCSVTDDEIRTAKRQFARRSGFCVEPASAAPLAGVAQLTERGAIDRDESVVLVPTGTGFKEMGTGTEAVRTETVARSGLSSQLESRLST
ncbi:pyridoxal-phosphate dependent enzyme [Halosolutus amylolyticus]|uniref:Pyridoxal-phosphate dependent enzyme n=1 Tax=Halosolutus amylolyticus TaxID=2932267 RepID=A0ABD5PMU8_9EURY|nr:threonine synthase [Halosolutus amylolyticus]